MGCAAAYLLSSFEKLDGTWKFTTGTYITTAEPDVVINAEVSDIVVIRPPRTEPIKVDYQYQGTVSEKASDITY